MKFVLINSDYEITGFDIFNNMIKEPFWFTISEDAYQYCMAHNASVYIKNTEDIETKIELFNSMRVQYGSLENPDDIPVMLTVEDLGYEKIHDLTGVIINKKRKHSILCGEAIEAGITYNLNGQRKRFTYTHDDQLNYAELETFSKEGVFDESGVPIKASGDSEYTYITTEEFHKIHNALRYNKYFNLLYLRILNEYIETITDPILLEKMTFEVVLPAEYSAKLDKLLAPYKKYLKEDK